MASKAPQTSRSGMRKSFVEALKGDWRRVARPNQLPPDGDWRIWLLLAGRGFGKTRTICEFVRGEVERGTACRIAFVAATAAAARDVLITGHSGILSISPEGNRPIYEPTKRLLTWPNGAIATSYSADEPDQLRGPQFDLAICDELAAWRYPEALDMLLLGLRIGRNPRVAIATTPRPTKIIRSLIAREGRDVVITRGSTLENKDNLAPAYVEQIIDRYKGTRLERQEIFGEVLDDVPGALWNRDMIERTRVADAPKELQRIVVAIDPAGSSEENADLTGIIVAGLGRDGHGYVLDDLSGRFTPTEWARRALGAYHVWKADKVVVERNFGGEMCAATIAAVDASVPVKTITSSRGKVLRAEPIAALFEQNRAHVVGSQPEMEDQACRFTPDWLRSRDGSPDRVDAMVFALSELMLEAEQPGRFISTDSLLVPSQQNGPAPVDDPGFLHTVFASVAGGIGEEPGALATVYFGADVMDATRPTLYVMDWEIYDLTSAPDIAGWWQHVFRQIVTLLPKWNLARSSGLLIEHTGVGGVLLQQGIMRGAKVTPLHREDHLKMTIPERAIAAAAHAYSNKVKLTRHAAEKVATFKGVTKNHFMAQVSAFGVGAAPQDAGPLLVAFSNAVLDVCGTLEEMRKRRN